MRLRREARGRGDNGGTELEVPAGQRLLTQGRPVLQLLVLTAGRAVVVVDGHPVAVLEPGAPIGWPQVLTAAPAPATVETTTAATLDVFARGECRRWQPGPADLFRRPTEGNLT